MPAQVATRIDVGLPEAVEAEKAALGAVLLEPALYHETASALVPADFFLDSHRRIFTHMGNLVDKGRAIDLIVLADSLGAAGELENIGGVAYLSSLTEGVPRRESIAGHLRLIREKAGLRAIIVTSNTAIARALDQEPADDVLADMQQGIIDVLYHGTPQVDLKQTGREWLLQMEEMRRSDRQCIGVPCGLEGVDELTTGYREKELTVVAARPGQGKTAFMCQSVRAAVKRGHKPGVFSIEVPREQIITRLACMETKLNVFDARDPRTMRPTDYQLLCEAAATVTHEWDFLIEDGRMTPKRLAAIARMWVAKGCDCIFVDYIGKLAARAPGKSEYDRVTATADGLWDLARFTGVPVVALCQLRRIEGPPTMEDLRSSGEIEQNAHSILLIHCPKEEGDDGPAGWTGFDQMIIAKQRSGPANVHVNVMFNRPVGLFEPRY